MYPRLYKSLKNNSFFVFGPRGSGKTTWLAQEFPTATTIDLLHDDTQRLLRASPSRLEGLIPPGQKTIVIDEVQKIPALLDEVHRLIEKRKLRFVLTGSSARKLKRGAANLLAGRALETHFYPLSIWELGKDFDLNKSLSRGLLPAAYQHEDPKRHLSAYVNTYIKEEIYAEGILRNLDNFVRFLEAISFSQAQVLSYAALARDCGVDPKVAASYVQVLEDLLLGKTLPVFSKKAKRRMTSHPKFFLFDTGVWKTLRPKGPLDTDADLEGAGLETLFFHHHQVLGEFTGWDQKLSFWRTQSKLEVDFVSYGSCGLFAFECKRSSMVRSEDLTSLKAFQEDYPSAKCFVLYGGTDERFVDGVQYYPFQKGLEKLPFLLGVSLDPKINSAATS